MQYSWILLDELLMGSTYWHAPEFTARKCPQATLLTFKMTLDLCWGRKRAPLILSDLGKKPLLSIWIECSFVTPIQEENILSNY